MIKRSLAYLLHHANRTTQSERFYMIKNHLLTRFGRVVGYDVQFIEGKKCYACHGSGVYTGYHYSGDQWHDVCNRCFGGWYKSPTWNVLAKVKFGKYTFHQPKERCYSEQAVIKYLGENRGLVHSVFDGYISHRRTKFGPYAVVILFLIFRLQIPRDFDFGLGWRIYWWRPDAWLNNVLYFYHRRHERVRLSAVYQYVASRAAARFPNWIEV